MLDIKFIRENKEAVKEAIKNRGMKLDIEELITLDEEHRKLLMEVEGLKAERNKANDEISTLMKEKKNPKDIIGKMKVVSQKIGELDKKVGEYDENIAFFMYSIRSKKPISFGSTFTHVKSSGCSAVLSAMLSSCSIFSVLSGKYLT